MLSMSIVATNSVSNDLFQSFSYLIFIILLGFLTYLITLIFSGKYLRLFKNKNIQLIERLFIDRENSIILVKLSNKYYFLLVGKNNMEIISEVDEEDINFPDVNNNFSKILKFKLKEEKEDK